MPGVGRPHPLKPTNPVLKVPLRIGRMYACGFRVPCGGWDIADPVAAATVGPLGDALGGYGIRSEFAHESVSSVCAIKAQFRSVFRAISRRALRLVPSVAGVLG